MEKAKTGAGGGGTGEADALDVSRAFLRAIGASLGTGDSLVQALTVAGAAAMALARSGFVPMAGAPLSTESLAAALQKIRSDLDWRGPAGKLAPYVVLEREQAEAILLRLERLRHAGPSRGDPETEPPRGLISLPGSWSLRKLSLDDKSEWALQYLGMDWIRISEFLPQRPPGTALDEDVRKFAATMNGEAVGSLRSGRRPAGRGISK